MKSSSNKSYLFKETPAYLITQLAHAHRSTAASILRRIGLYPGQELLLMELWDDGIQSQLQLGEALGIDASTITKMAQRLEAQGFVQRARSAADKRQMLISLTAQGQAIKPQIVHLWAELERITLANLTIDEELQTTALLHSMIHNLKEAKADHE